MRMDRWVTQTSTHRSLASIERSYESSATKQLQDETPPQAIPLPKPALLTQSWIFEPRRFYHRYFTNHRTPDRQKIFPKYKIKYRNHCVFTLATHTEQLARFVNTIYIFNSCGTSLGSADGLPVFLS